jgi:hypothetical protein
MHPTRRLLLIATLFAVAAPLPALASPPHGEKKKEGAEEGGSAAEEKEVARSVELGGLVFPVFDDRQKLQNYLFVNARMRVGPGKDPWKYREKGHIIRDAVIRAAHRVSFNVKGDKTKLDEKLAEAECLKAANAAVGEPDALVSMTFTQIASQNSY